MSSATTEDAVTAVDEGKLTHTSASPTAATRGKRLFKRSGVMAYRVMLSNGSAMFPFEVDAATGDEAATRALVKNPGCKVAKVAPVSDPDWIDPSAYFDDEYEA